MERLTSPTQSRPTRPTSGSVSTPVPLSLARAKSGSIAFLRSHDRLPRPLPPTPLDVPSMGSTDHLSRMKRRSQTMMRRASHQPALGVRKGSSDQNSSSSPKSRSSLVPLGQPPTKWEAVLRVRVIEAKINNPSNTVIDTSGVGNDQYYVSVGNQRTNFSVNSGGSSSGTRGTPFWYEDIVIDLNHDRRDLVKCKSTLPADSARDQSVLTRQISCPPSRRHTILVCVCVSVCVLDRVDVRFECQ